MKDLDLEKMYADAEAERISARDSNRSNNAWAAAGDILGSENSVGNFALGKMNQRSTALSDLAKTNAADEVDPAAKIRNLLDRYRGQKSLKDDAKAEAAEVALRDPNSEASQMKRAAMVAAGVKVPENSSAYQLDSVYGKSSDYASEAFKNRNKNESDQIKYANDRSLKGIEHENTMVGKAYDMTGNASLLTQKGRQEIARIGAQGDQDRQTKGTANYADLMAPKGKKAFDMLPKDRQEQIDVLSKKQGSVLAINNEIKSAYEQLNDPNLSEDDKVKIGQGLLKTLNSTQGSDAVGAEESKRLGSYLEYKLGNFTGPGSFVGRDMADFNKQVGLISQKLDSTMQKNDGTIKALYGTESPISESVALNPGKKSSGSVIKDAKAAGPMNEQDKSALQWAKQNIKDPRAIQIYQRLKGRE